MHNIKFYITFPDEIEIEERQFPNYNPRDTYSLYFYDNGGAIYKYEGSNITTKDMIKFLNEKLDVKSAAIERGKQRRCVLPTIDKDSYEQHLSRGDVYVLVYKQELKLDFSKPEISWLVLDAVKKLNQKYEVYFLKNDEFGESQIKKYSIEEKEHPQIFIIDTAKLSMKYIKTEYQDTLNIIFN